jgi:hypothetical protein
VVGSQSGDNDPVGTVEILSGDQVLDSAELGEADQGQAAFTLSGLTPDSYPLRARFTPTQESPFLKSVSQTTSVVVRKVSSTITLKVGDKAAAGKPAPARIRVTAPGVTPVGTVVIRDNGRVIERVTLEEADAGTERVVLPALEPGVHRLRAVFQETALIKRAVSENVVVKVRRA